MSSNPQKPIEEPLDLDRPASITPLATLDVLQSSEVPDADDGAHMSTHVAAAVTNADTNNDSHDPLAALRYRDFRLYAVGSFLSALGAQMQAVAVGWELYERTHSALALGLMGLAAFLPALLLALPAGHLADRFNRKTLVIIGLAAAVACSLGLAAVSHWHGPILLTYAFLSLGAAAGAFQGPASSAIQPQLVPAEVFANAAIWNSSRWQFASVAGPALGGVLIATQKSATPVYVLDAMCGALFLVLMTRLRVPPREGTSERMDWQNLLAGLRFVKGEKIVLATITLDMFAVLLGGATALLPVFAKDILHVGPTGLGWLRAAPAAGAVCMALGLALLPPLKRAGKTLLWAVAGFGAATIVFGVSRNFYLSLAMLFLTGALDNISVVIRHTLVQLLTPDAMRGRVSAVNSVFIGTSNELGALESGVAAWALGPIWAVALGGVGTIAVVAFVARAWPQVRRLGSLQNAHG